MANQDSESVTVTCTDRGQHTRTALASLTVNTDGTLAADRARTQRGAWGRSASAEDGTSIADFAVVSTSTSRDDYEGRERWRFRCPRCRRDVILSGERCSAAVRALLDAGVSDLDVSLVQ